MKYLLLILLLLPVTVMAKEVTLSWDASPTAGVTGYNVYRSFSADMSEAIGVNVPDGLTKKLVDLDNTKQYWFAVTAHDATGYESVYSNIVTSPACVQPDAPVLDIDGSQCINIQINIGG